MARMKYGFVLLGSDKEVVELAQEAEAAGWDGIFLPDDYGSVWLRLAAIAMKTEHIHLGTMLTPLPQHHPWTVAAQAATLDHLSNGRVILAAGLGVLELDKVGLQENRKRAQMLDEGLELLSLWWQGTSMRDLTYQGRHYQLTEMAADVPWPTHKPLQQSRIPIWVVGGEKASQVRRAASWDGALMHGSPEEVRQRRVAIEALRTDARSLEYIVEGETPGNDPEQASAIARAYAEAGATWWIESMWEEKERGYDMLGRIKMGPPGGDPIRR